MSDTLPRQPDPEAVLAALPAFAGATVHRQLSDGPTNASFQVGHEGRAYVLRIDKPGASRLGLDRTNEERLSRAAAAAGLAPQIVYSEPGQGILLREFLPGRSWTGRDLQNSDNLAWLARRLERLHALDVEADPFDPVRAARRYTGQLATPEAARLLDRLEHLAADIGAPERPAPCHNDLLAQNLLEVDSEPASLVLIDWEYAAPGDPWFDLATVIQHHHLPAPLSSAFIEAYLHRSPTPAELEHLGQQRRFYQHLLDLWNMRVKE